MSTFGFRKQDWAPGVRTGIWVLQQGRGEFSSETTVDVLRKWKTNKVIATEKKRENALGN